MRVASTVPRRYSAGDLARGARVSGQTPASFCDAGRNRIAGNRPMVENPALPPRLVE